MPKSDIESARDAKMQPITKVGEKLGIPADALMQFGPSKAKLSFSYLESLKKNKNGKLILVTAISPTPAGEGKTTTTVGLGDGLNRIGKKAMICLREPSLGPRSEEHTSELQSLMRNSYAAFSLIQNK